MYFDDEVKADIKERLSEMVHPVKLVVFSQALQHPEKLKLFAVFGFIDHLARLHRRWIVSANVVQQMQGLWGALGSRGQQVEAARHQRRQQ